MEQTIKKTLLMLCVVSIIAAGLPVAVAENQTNVSQNATPTVTTPVVTTPPAATAVPTVAKFRVGPTVNLRPVTEVIERNQDGIVELYMDNSDLNDVTLTVEARITAPSGIHVYGVGFALAGAAGVVMGKFEVPPGTARTISVNIKADESARIGSHSIKFTGLYYPGDNKDNYQPLSLTYPVTVKEASKEPEKPPEGAETPKPSIPGFGVVLAILGVFAMARLMSRKI